MLIKHPDFALPGRKALLKSDMSYEIVLIDTTETPIEWPKKPKIFLFRKKEKTHVKKPGDSQGFLIKFTLQFNIEYS